MIALLLGCASRLDVETGFASPAEAPDLDPAEGAVAVELIAAATGTPTSADGHTHDSGGHSHDTATTTAYAYNGQVPGPTIRAKVGDVVSVTLVNELTVPTDVHWYGLDVPAGIDGSSERALEPGDQRTFSFPVTRAGTFWYRAASDVATQVTGGLYGAFIVEDPAEPVAARELVVVWQTSAGGSGSHDAADDADAHGQDTAHATAKAVSSVAASPKSTGHDHAAHAVTDPADLVWTANGVATPTVRWRAGEQVRVRMINVSAKGFLDLAWPGLRRIAGDQGLLAAADTTAPALLAPGDRGDFEWTGGAFAVTTGLYSEAGGLGIGDPVVVLDAEGAASAPLDWPFSGEAPTADPGRTDILVVLAGGGDTTWLVNGAAWPDTAPATATVGEERILEIRNLSGAEHPIHLHGPPFEVLSVDGVVPGVRTWEDTLDVPVLGTARLRWVPTQAGDWPLHCQAQAHEEGGMKMVIHVE